MSDLNQPGRPDEGGGGDIGSSEDRMRQEVGLEEGEQAPPEDGSDALSGPSLAPPD